MKSNKPLAKQYEIYKDGSLRGKDYTLPTEQKKEATIGVVYDSTDHFQFYCLACKRIPKVLLVHSAVDGTIWFNLKCPQCGGEATRKIYLGKGGSPLDEVPEDETYNELVTREHHVLATMGIFD